MSISRTEVEIVVTGATAAEAGLRSVAAAESAVASQAMAATPAVNRLSQSMQDMTKAGMSYNSMTMTWEKQTKAVAAANADAAKSATAMAKGLELGGKAMSGIMRLAYLLPGFGFAGILLGIGNAAEFIYEKMTGAAGATNGATTALSLYAAQAVEAADAVARLADEQARLAGPRIQGGLKGGGYAGQSGRMIAASNEEAAANAEIERLTRLRVEMERNPAAEAFTSADEDRIRRLNEAAAKLRANPGAGWSAGNLEGLSYQERAAAKSAAYQAAVAASDAMATDYERQAAHIVDTQRLSAEQIDDLIASTQNRVRDLTKDMDRMSGKVDEVKTKAKAAGVKDFDSGNPWWYRERTRAALDAADAERARKNRERDFAGPGFAYPRTDDEIMAERMNARPGFAYPKSDTPLMSAMAQMGDSFTGTFDRMAAGATDAAGIMVQAIGTITTALGSMMTNLIISGDAGAKGLKKMAGNALAGVSAQAFGFAVFLEAAALAAALSGPILGWSAPELATAGAVMAGAGAALGVTARMLGADQIGAAKGGAKGGGGAPASAAGTNPFGGTGNQQTQVVVYIGSEVVTRGVQTETRRTALRGGITEGRMAMAS